MGLDMYLYAEKHIDQYDYVDEPNNKVSRRDNLDYDKANALVSNLPTGEYGGITITKCVAYWRKANAVHGWIVREIANGVDTCQRIELSREDLIKLRDACLVGLSDRDKAKPNAPDTRTYNFKEINKDEDKVIFDMIEAFKREAEKSRNKVTVVNADDPIPPTSGFFFGGTEKDEYYYSYLAETADTINSILASDPEDTLSYYYQASW